MTQETNNLAADLWALADLLRGDFKHSQYGRIILPFTLLRRLECVLESNKSAVLVEAAKVWPRYASRIWYFKKIARTTSWSRAKAWVRPSQRTKKKSFCCRSSTA